MSKPTFRNIGCGWLCVSNCTYLFTDRQFEKMLYNYKLGNCAITDKGLMRYSDFWF